ANDWRDRRGRRESVAVTSLLLRRMFRLRTEEVALAKANAVMAQDRVGRGQVKKEIGHGVLHEIVRPRHPLALPARLADHRRGGAREITGREAIEQADRLTDTPLQCLEGLPGLWLGIGRNARKERRCSVHGVAADQ